jgi:hypothetical protein
VELDKIPWGQISSPSLLGFFIILLFTGRLVSRAILEDMREQRDFFKAAWSESQASNGLMEDRLDANTDALRAVELALHAVIEGDRRQ